MNPKKYFATYPHLLLLSILWMIVQSVLLMYHNIYTSGEALRIIREATYLNNGEAFSNPIYFTYLTEILLTTLSLMLGKGFWLNYIVHLLFNIIALHAFYHLIVNILQSQKLALVGCLLLLVCIPYQLYNTFIYTESIFFSLSIVYTFLLFRKGKRTGGWLATTILVLILLCITRPSGLFFLAASIVYGFFRTKDMSWWLKTIVFGLPTILLLILINAGMQSGGGINIIEPFLREHVICDVPKQTSPVALQLSENKHSLYGLMYYITHNFTHFMGLAMEKSMAFFGLMRPWNSAFHNILLAAFFYPLYALSIISLIRKKISGFMVFALALLIINWVFVLFSCDEWHNRFFLLLTPFIILMALHFFSNKNISKRA